MMAEGQAGQVAFVGVGPGDPELMTIKAVSAIRNADVLALADSGTHSVVMRILGDLAEGKQLLRLKIPMTGDRAQWTRAHGRAAELVEECLLAGKHVAYPVLGDPSLYASSGYLLARLKDHFACEVIPGVPAMCAAAAAAQVPLCEGRERLTVLPGFSQGEPLPAGNALVMKAGGALEAIAGAALGRKAYVVRNLGMPDAQVGTLQDEFAPSYFTTVLVKAEGETAHEAD
ncbi:MAG: precorrin-2 C(20)-methyltransferase [Clostridia bacterium]